MTVIAPSSTPSTPKIETSLSRFVEELKAHRAALQEMDWTPPGPPPEEPPQRDWRLQWESPGAVNQVKGTPISLEALREELPKRIKDYLSDPKDDRLLLIRVAAGAGKTHTAVQIAQQYAEDRNQRVLWAGSRHDMFKDLMLIPGFKPELWYHWLPIRGDEEAPDDPRKTTCRYYKEQRIWGAKGYDAFGLCEQLCGTFTDGHLSKCPYRLQAKAKQRIIYGMHQHLASGLAIKNFKAAIIDEVPLGAFTETRHIPTDDLVLEGAGSFLKQFLELLRNESYALSKNKRLSGKELFDKIGDLLGKTYTQVEVLPEAIPLAPDIGHPSQVNSIPAWFIQDLLMAAANEQAAWEAKWDTWAERIWLARDGLYIVQRSETWEHLPKKLVALDATGQPGLYKQLLGREVEVYDPEIERKGRLYQVTGRLNGKSTMLRKGRPTRQANEALELSKQIAEPYREKNQRVCVVCQKDLVTTFEAEFGEDNTAYFYNLRGTNALLTAKCLIVVGAPAPDMRSVIYTATALDPDRQAAFAPVDEEGNFRPLLHIQEREYRVRKQVISDNGGKTPRRAMKGFWADHELQALYDQARESELVQALHRARLNVRDCTVWLLTSVPTGEPLDGIWDDPPVEAGFPEGIYWRQWLKIKPWLDKQPDGKRLTYEDIAAIAEVTPEHVRKQKWLDVILKTSDWQAAVIEKSGRGRAKKAIQRGSAA